MLSTTECKYPTEPLMKDLSDKQQDKLEYGPWSIAEKKKRKSKKHGSAQKPKPQNQRSSSLLLHQQYQRQP